MTCNESLILFIGPVPSRSLIPRRMNVYDDAQLILPDLLCIMPTLLHTQPSSGLSLDSRDCLDPLRLWGRWLPHEDGVSHF